MKTNKPLFSSLVVLGSILLFSCNSDLKQKNKDLSYEDSVLGAKNKLQDSSIMAYVKGYNEIQDNLDSIKIKAKLLTVSNSESGDQKDQIVADMRAIGDLMMKNKRDLAILERKLKKSNGKNAELQKMVDRLSAEVTEKDAEIASLQNQLAASNESLKEVIKQLNDSMKTISTQKEQITDMTSQMNTVYYAIGTTKELKKNGVIDKEGSIAGIGGAKELKKDFNTSYFTKSDMTTLQALPLFSKFSQLVTTHPTGSYKISGNDKVDSLVITDSKAFWSQSKYLVVIVKQH